MSEKLKEEVEQEIVAMAEMTDTTRDTYVAKVILSKPNPDPVSGWYELQRRALTVTRLREEKLWPISQR